MHLLTIPRLSMCANAGNYDQNRCREVQVDVFHDLSPMFQLSTEVLWAEVLFDLPVHLLTRNCRQDSLTSAKKIVVEFGHQIPTGLSFPGAQHVDTRRGHSTFDRLE